MTKPDPDPDKTTIAGEIGYEAEISERLREETPVARAAFRGSLRASLMTASNDWSPMRARLTVAAYSGFGAVLLGIAVLGIAGVGPLAAG